MVVSSGHQSAMFSYASNQVGGQVFSSTESVKHYFSLDQANKQLIKENTSLRLKNKESYLDRSQGIFSNTNSPIDSLNKKNLFSDTLTPAFDYLSAKVISNSIHKKKNYFMLNKGRKQGIRENMGVIGPQGGVGIVHSVSNDFCTAISLINIDTRISAKLLSNNELGSLSWDGKDSKIAQLNSIETYIPIEVGDSIVSSGYSHIFPESILLGTILDFSKTIGENTYHINIKLSTNFSALSYVTVIRNIYLNEQISLDKLEENQK